MSESKTPLIITLVVSAILIGAVVFFAARSGIDPEVKNAVLADDRISFGKDDSEIVITKFTDFQCPGCASFGGTMDLAIEEYDDRVKFQFKHLPLVAIHPNAVPAAYGAEAANNQDLFLEFIAVLYERQGEWGSLEGAELRAKMIDYAILVEIPDMEKFETDMESEEVKKNVADDLEDAEKLGLQSTPTVYLGEKKLSILQLDKFFDLLDGELE